MTRFNATFTGTKPPAISVMLPERVVAHIEHYCNSGDMVTRWGALFSAKSILQNRFCGHIFINGGVTRHMLNQYYLSDMFPIHYKKGGVGHAEGTSSEAKNYGVPFLRLDTATVPHRNSNAAYQLAVIRDESALDRGDNSYIAHTTPITEIHHSQTQAEYRDVLLELGEGSKLISKDLSGAEGSRISVVIVQDPNNNRGKTVR